MVAPLSVRVTSTRTRPASRPCLIALSTRFATASNRRSRSPVTKAVGTPARAQRDVLVLGRGVEQLHHLARDVREIDGAEHRGAVLRLDLRNAGEGGEHGEHPVELADGIADQRLVGLTVARPPGGLLQAAAHAGERRAQVVRDVVGRLLHLAHQRLDAVEHAIEVLGEPVPFVAGSAQRNPLAEIALHDRAADRVDRLDPSDGAARDIDGHHSGEDEDHRQRQRERGVDLCGKAAQIVDVLADQEAQGRREA